MADFDPIAFSGGFGAGQQSKQSEVNNANLRTADADHRASLAQAELERERRSADAEGDQMLMVAGMVGQLKAEVNQRWIPYAVGLRASLFARAAERNVLIEELRRLDPANVEAAIQRADTAGSQEYTNICNDETRLQEVVNLAHLDSEKRRNDKQG